MLLFQRIIFNLLFFVIINIILIIITEVLLLLLIIHLCIRASPVQAQNFAQNYARLEV